MTPLCKIEVTHPRVQGSREVRRGGVVVEQAGVQPSDVLLRVQSGRLRVTDACVLIGVQRRQVFRLLRGLKQDGATSLLSKRRVRPSNHRLPDEVRTLALSIVRERYCDFGPSLAAEKLAEHHGCSVSRETLRGWMIADGLWQDRRHRLPSPHQPRRRRDCLGELVQIDGSEHAWFEDPGPPCTLLAFVDDATSRLMELRFVTSESAFDYFRATRDQPPIRDGQRSVLVKCHAGCTPETRPLTSCGRSPRWSRL
jgi:hypothetical protein